MDKGGLYDPPKTLHSGLYLVPTETPASSVITLAPTPGQAIPEVPLQTSTHAPDPVPRLPSLFKSAADVTATADPAATSSTDKVAENGTPHDFLSPQRLLSDRESDTPSILANVGPLVTVRVYRPPTKPHDMHPQAIYSPKPISSNQPVSGHDNIPPGLEDLAPSRLTNILSGDHTAPASSPLLLVLNGQTYTADSHTNFVVDSQTLTPGGIITIGSTNISLDTTAPRVVFDGTATLSLLQAQVAPTGRKLVTLPGGSILTIEDLAHLVVGDVTLVPGSATVVDGVTVSVEVGGGVIAVVEGSTSFTVALNGSGDGLIATSTHVASASRAGALFDVIETKTVGAGWGNDWPQGSGVGVRVGDKESRANGRIGTVDSVMAYLFWSLAVVMLLGD